MGAVLTDALDLLICPLCGTDWDPGASGPRQLVCAEGHRYDAARQGYVSFLTGRGTGLTPDTAEMVTARDRFLAAGHYAPIAEALAAACAPLPAEAAILDAGAGTGYHLTAVLDVFSPRNLPEFARVTTRGGLLCAVTPLPGHLAELRGRLPLLDIPEGKAEALEHAASHDYQPVSREHLEFSLALSPDAAADLVQMGPAGHHTDRGELERLVGGEDLTATAAVELSVLRRR